MQHSSSFPSSLAHLLGMVGNHSFNFQVITIKLINCSKASHQVVARNSMTSKTATQLATITSNGALWQPLRQ